MEVTLTKTDFGSWSQVYSLDS